MLVSMPCTISTLKCRFFLLEALSALQLCEICLALPVVFDVKGKKKVALDTDVDTICDTPCSSIALCSVFGCLQYSHCYIIAGKCGEITQMEDELQDSPGEMKLLCALAEKPKA